MIISLPWLFDEFDDISAPPKCLTLEIVVLQSYEAAVDSQAISASVVSSDWLTASLSSSNWNAEIDTEDSLQIEVFTCS